MKALYAVSRLHEWTDISKRLKKNYNIEPVYWIHSKLFREEIIDLYPNAVFHETQFANKAIPAENVILENYLVDKDTIMEFMEIERDFYIMLNRHDMDRSFSFDDRRDLYYEQLSYWLYVVKKYEITIAVFSETPHTLAHYIIYSICKKLNIDTIMLSFTTIPGLLYAKNSFEDVPTISVESNKNRVKGILEDVIEVMSEGNHKPWYMLEQEQKMKRQLSIKKNIKQYYHNIRYLLEIISIKKPLAYKTFYKKKGKRFQESYYSKSEYSHVLSKNRKKLSLLKDKYKHLSQDPDLSSKYIYFPLHYQPERSSCPEGTVYTDQKMVISMLSYVLPEGWKLYVKEHPSQFMLNRSLLGRTDYYYEDILKNNNVKLIDDSFPSIELVKKAKAVVTLTGTVGFEAIIKGVPVLVFGYAWYRDLPGSFYIKNNFDLVKALGKIRDGKISDRNSTIDSLRAMKQYLFLGYLGSGNEKAIDIDYNDHVNELYNGYAALLDNMGYRRNIK